MTYTIRKIDYCYLTIPSRAGQGAKILGELKEAGINLVAFSGFPSKRGMAQFDLVAENMAALKKVAKKNGWRLSKTKKGFLMQGDDEVGAAYPAFQKLAELKINITAADAVSAGNGRFGMIFWVKPKDYNRAAKALITKQKPRRKTSKAAKQVSTESVSEPLSSSALASLEAVLKRSERR